LGKRLHFLEKKNIYIVRFAKTGLLDTKKVKVMQSKGDRTPSKDVWIQSLCRKSNAWDEALRGSRHQTHKKVHAERRMLLDIENASYKDYIGSNLGTGTPGTTCCTVEQGHAASQPMAIPSATGCSTGLDNHCKNVISSGHSEYLCSPSDLCRARNMWVPQNTPPAVEVSRCFVA
jgi:hypothetical protein